MDAHKEAVWKGMPTDVQIVIKVPHYVVDQGRVYLSWFKVPKSKVPAIIDLIDGEEIKEKPAPKEDKKPSLIKRSPRKKKNDLPSD